MAPKAAPPAPAAEPAPADGQQVVYHVYQHGFVGATGQNFSVNEFPVSFYLRPILLFLQWALWVIYIAGAAQASPLSHTEGSRLSRPVMFPQTQSTCNQGNNNNFYPFGTLTGFPASPSPADCSQYYSLLW